MIVLRARHREPLTGSGRSHIHDFEGDGSKSRSVTTRELSLGPDHSTGAGRFLARRQDSRHMRFSESDLCGKNQPREFTTRDEHLVLKSEQIGFDHAGIWRNFKCESPRPFGMRLARSGLSRSASDRPARRRVRVVSSPSERASHAHS